MKKVVLLHTVQSVYLSFEGQMRATLGDMPVQWINFVDEYLAIEPNTIGEFTPTNRERLACDLRSCAMTGADLIVVTCSTLSPWLHEAKAGCTCPVVAIDERMVHKALEMACRGRITVLATQHSAEKALCQSLRQAGARAGKSLEIATIVRTDAMDALKRGDAAQHDAILLEMARQVPPCDVVLVAQASMAHMEEKIQETCHIPTLSGPKLCIAQVAAYLRGMEDRTNG